MSRRQFIVGLILLWVAATGLRLGYLWEVSDSPMWLVHMGDARSYHEWAQGIVAGDWWGTEVFYQAPLYPYFMAGVYTLLGDGPWALRIVQCLLGAAGCVFLALAGARLATRPAGLLAGGMLACYPPAIFFDGLIQKTVLTSFLVCLLLAIMARQARAPRALWGWLRAGIVIGLLALVRENALLLAGLAPLWILAILRRDPRRRTAAVILCLLGVAMILTPVAYRNRTVGSEWHPTTSQFGPNFYIGNNTAATGLYVPLVPDRGDPLYEQNDAETLAEDEFNRELSPGEVSRYWTWKTWEDIAADPVGWLRLIARKLWIGYADFEIIDTEDQYTYAEYSWILSSLTRVWGMGALVPLATFGTILLFRNRFWRGRFAWPMLMIIGYTASLLLFFILARYRFPLVPPLILLAAVGLWQARRLVRRWARQSTRRRRRQQARRLIPAFSMALLAAALVAIPASRNVYPVAIAKGVTRDNLGKHLYFAGYPERMIRAQYQRGIHIAPELTSIRVHFAEILWDWGYRDEAREQLAQALRIDPDDPALLTRHGLMLRWQGNFQDSARQLRTAARLAPNAPEPHYHLATTLLSWADDAAARGARGFPGVAIPGIRGASRPSPAEIHQMRKEALAHLRRGETLEEDSESIHAALGHALVRLGRRGAAAREFQKAAACAPPDSPRRHDFQELARRLAQDPDELADGDRGP